MSVHQTMSLAQEASRAAKAARSGAVRRRHYQNKVDAVAASIRADPKTLLVDDLKHVDGGILGLQISRRRVHCVFSDLPGDCRAAVYRSLIRPRTDGPEWLALRMWAARSILYECPADFEFREHVLGVLGAAYIVLREGGDEDRRQTVCGAFRAAYRYPVERFASDGLFSALSRFGVADDDCGLMAQMSNPGLYPEIVHYVGPAYLGLGREEHIG